MKSRSRIAVLVAALLAAPAGVVAVEQAAPYSPRAQTDAIGVEWIVGAAGPGGAQRARPSETFPQGSDQEYERTPAELAYLARLEQERRHLVGRLDVFPLGAEGENGYDRPPVLIAYFKQLEQRRIPATEPQAAAPVEEQGNPFLAIREFFVRLFS